MGHIPPEECDCIHTTICQYCCTNKDTAMTLKLRPAYELFEERKIILHRKFMEYAILEIEKAHKRLKLYCVVDTLPASVVKELTDNNYLVSRFNPISDRITWK
jgi:hypothetical protein